MFLSRRRLGFLINIIYLFFFPGEDVRPLRPPARDLDGPHRALLRLRGLPLQGRRGGRVRGGGRKGDLPEEDQGHSRKAKGQAGEEEKRYYLSPKVIKKMQEVSLNFAKIILGIL